MRRWSRAGALFLVLAFLLATPVTALAAPAAAPSAADACGPPGSPDVRPYEHGQVGSNADAHELMPMKLIYLRNHPEILGSGRNVTVVESEPTPEYPHYRHLIASTINGYDGRSNFATPLDVWEDGVPVPGPHLIDARLDGRPCLVLPATRNSPVDVRRVNKHAEFLVAHEAERLGINRGTLTRMLSDLDACTLPGHDCREKLRDGLMGSLYPGLLELDYSWPYPDDAAVRQASIAAMIRFRQWWKAQGMPGIDGTVLERLAERFSAKMAGDVLARTRALPSVPAGTGRPGGVDFSSVELRYLAESRGGFGYAFSARPGAGGNPAPGLRAVGEQSDAFFVWLAADPRTFWVNLKPDEPGRIVDPVLARTDVGRILLEADLRLKKTVARLIHPDTPLGARFWRELGDGSPSGLPQSCLSFRQWIVPAPATVAEHDDGVQIVDAPLSVQMESEHFATPGVAAGNPACAAGPAEQRHDEDVFRALVLPRVVQDVNTAPEYADLRRVYLSRVAAEWYRGRSARGPTRFGDLIDSGDTTAWTSVRPWSPDEVFGRYLRSYRDGEFRVTHRTTTGSTVRTDTYVFGGVDFGTVPFHPLDADGLERLRPGLPETVERAFTGPAVDRDGTLWAGTRDALPGAPGPAGPDRIVSWVVGGAIAAGLLTALSRPVARRFSTVRRRRRAARAEARRRALVARRLRELAPPGRDR